jgi:hypothetical protein
MPSEVLKTYSGIVGLREDLDEDLLRKELEELGVSGSIVRISNPWYFRRKGTGSWIKIGESEERPENFHTRWDTTGLENGQYEIMGLMHVFVKKDNTEIAIARDNIVEISVQN